MRRRTVEGLALVLVAAVAPFALWMSRLPGDDGTLERPDPGGLPISRESVAGEGLVTYRFLYRHEAGAIADRLTLGRFVGGDLARGRTWGFVNATHWFKQAPEIFTRERGWVAEDQPGWRISTWLCADESVDCDRMHLFWAIQALRYLDPESLANEIDMIEQSGGAVRICPTQGCCSYDYETNTLCWNPVSCEYVPKYGRLDWKWFKTDPLIGLGHELKHAWHDLCCGGDRTDEEGREAVAVAAENRLRHILFLKDPAHAQIYPRPGHQETWPDLPGASAEEAWGDYRGAVKY